MFYKVRESYINMRRKPHCRTNKQISTDILLRTNQFKKFPYTLYLKLLSTTKILEFKSNLSCSFLQCCPLTSCSFSHLVSLSACKYLSFTQAFIKPSISSSINVHATYDIIKSLWSRNKNSTTGPRIASAVLLSRTDISVKDQRTLFVKIRIRAREEEREDPGNEIETRRTS